MDESNSKQKDAVIDYSGTDSNSDDDSDSITVVEKISSVKIENCDNSVKIKEERLFDNASPCGSKKGSKPVIIKSEKFDKHPDWWTKELTDLKKECASAQRKYNKYKTERNLKAYREIKSKYTMSKLKARPKNWKTREVAEVKCVTKEEKEKQKKERLKNEKRQEMLKKFNFDGIANPSNSERKKWGYVKNKEWMKHVRKEKHTERVRKYREQKEKQSYLPNGRSNLYNHPEIRK